VGVVTFVITPKQGKREYAELGIVLSLTFLNEVSMTILWYTFRTTVNLAYSIFNLTTLPLLVLLYRRRMTWVSKDKIAAFIIVPFLLFGLINLFFIQGVTKFNSYTIAFSSVAFIVISISYFFILIRELPTESITKLPMFWINSAILIISSGTFVIYLSADYLANVINNNMIGTWFVHNFVGLIYYAILWRALLLVRSDHAKEVK
jgi:hypothetical protein